MTRGSCSAKTATRRYERRAFILSYFVTRLFWNGDRLEHNRYRYILESSGHDRLGWGLYLDGFTAKLECEDGMGWIVLMIAASPVAYCALDCFSAWVWT